MKYIQFIGTQRSGSNLLRVMLNQEPEISAPHPPHILKTFFPLLPLYGNLQIGSNFRMLAVDVCEWIKRNPVPWEKVDLDPNEIISICKSPTLIELFTRIYEYKAAVDGASMWCCKSMENIYYAKAIEEYGLRPFYIYLYRDGRDVALSFKNAIVGPKHIYHLAQKWRKEQELAIQLIQNLPESRFVSVRYEDLLVQPKLILKTICLKLGIPFREEILDYFHSHESHLAARAGDMWKNLTRPIITTNSNKFRQGLSKPEIEIFEAEAGDMLDHLNYELMYSIKNQGVSIADIAAYDLINRNLIEETFKNADPKEKSKRKLQDDLLMDIQRRTVNSI